MNFSVPSRLCATDPVVDACLADALSDEFAITFFRASPPLCELRQYPVGGEHGMRFGGSRGAAVAAPFPPAGVLHGFRPHGIEHDVAADF